MACAGHINFNDEVSAAMRLADGVLLVVDAAEGTMVVTEKVVKQALAEGLPITLLLTKARLLHAPHLAYIPLGGLGECTSKLNHALTVACLLLLFPRPMQPSTWPPLRRIRARSSDVHILDACHAIS